MLVSGGAVNVTTYFMMRLAADGTAATGLTPADFDLQYTRSGEAAVTKVDATLNGNGVGGAHSDSTVIEVDATSSPGLYRVDWVDAAFAAGVREVILMLKVATAFTEPQRVEIDADVNVAKISLDSTAADNLELQYDGTGLSGDTFPAPQSQVGSITVGAGGIATVAESATITTGTQTLTYTATEALDGTTHDVADDTGNTDFYYQFDVGSAGIATEFIWFGYAQSQNDSYAVLAWDWVSTSWKQIGNISGGNGTTIAEHAFIPTVNMTGTGANAGKVRLQFTSADGTEIFTDRVICEFTQAAQGIANGSTITLGASTISTNLIGKDWILALGGQDITNSFISGATVSGIGTATAKYEFEECDLGAVTLHANGHIEKCGLEDTFTIGEAGTFTFHECFTQAGGTITIDFAAVGTTIVHMFAFDGEVNFKNMAAGDLVHITGAGTITTEACSAGTIKHDGFFEYVDAGGNVTEEESDLLTGVDAIQVVTAKMVFTKANELDVNTKSINEAEVIGDGNATPWDGI